MGGLGDLAAVGRVDGIAEQLRVGVSIGAAAGDLKFKKRKGVRLTWYNVC